MSSAKPGSFTFSLLIYVPFISYVLARPRVSSTVLNRSYENGHCCLGMNLRRKHSIHVILSMMFILNCFVDPFIRLRKFPPILNLLFLLRSLVINRC